MTARDAATDREWERRNWRTIEEIFLAAHGLPAAERAQHLARACAGDARLEARVRALLAAEPEAADAVGRVAAEASPIALARAEAAQGELDEPPPDRIGPYEILGELGRGGSSSVYLAERADGTFKKRVALKLVRRGLDTQDILRRLRQERQILARLEHPNVARLLDGGSADDGRPYFVMEHVDGLPIDEHCARHGLDLRARLELFLDACRAVELAHRNLTIHRDLKPSNILVAAAADESEDPIVKPTVKLLDFGIAKVLEPDDAFTSLQVTGPGLRVMTPAYASPEQIRGEGLTTATDVYSLGVLLFRLLTGAMPYTLWGASVRRLEEQILETPPPRPSQRVDEVSMQAMGLPPSRLRRHRARLRGDLDTIVGMALRKEPDRRYGTAEQLADDLQRHLNGLPVRAQPDRWSYRARKFIGRHVAALTVAALVVLLLTGVVGFFSARLVAERDRAVEALARAELERSKSSRVTGFLQQIFEVSDPGRSQGETITAVQLLERGAEQIERELAGEPEVRASLLSVIGTSYAGLGLYPEAAEHLEQSLELERRLAPPPDEALAALHQQLGNVRATQGRFDDAERHFSESFEQRRALFGTDSPQAAESRAELAALAHLRGRHDEAEAGYRRAIAALRSADQPGPEALRAALQAEGNLVTLLYDQQRLDEAEPIGRRVLEGRREVFGINHPGTLVSEQTLAAILVAAGSHAEAEPLLRDLLERQRELLGDEHPNVALALNNLAAALYYLGRFDEAGGLYRRALAIQVATHGEDHALPITTTLNLADLIAIGRGDDEAARPLYESAIERRRRLVPAGSLALVDPLSSLGKLELRADRAAAAERAFGEAVEILDADARLPEPRAERWRLAEARTLLAEALLAQGRSREAAPLLEQGFAVLDATFGGDDERTVRARSSLESLAASLTEPPAGVSTRG